MTHRICPKCKTTLGSYDHFFCSNCGEELKGELINPGNSIVQSLTLESASEKKLNVEEHLIPVLKNVFHILNLKDVALVIILFLVVGVPSIVWIGNLNNYVAEVPKNTNKVETIREGSLIKIDSDFKSHVFGSDFVEEYVPYDVDAYIEVNDFQKFSELFYLFDPGYEEILTTLAPRVDSHFAAFLITTNNEPVWTIILFPFEELRDSDAEIDFSKYSWLEVDQIDKALILTTGDTIKSVRNARLKIDKNLSMNPNFVRNKSQIAKNGKVMVITFNDAGKNYFRDIPKNNLPEDYVKLIETYNKATLKNLVFN